MRRVALILPENAYAPEIYALHNFLSKYYSESIYSEIIKYSVFLQKQKSFDIVYRMMGFSPKILNPCLLPEIHDYASLSLGKYSCFKEFAKRKFQKKPIFRLFLNDYVRKRMSFNDNVPYSLRDMGVDGDFFNIFSLNLNKIYDFCYIGSICDERNIDSILDFFKDNKSFNIVLVGDNLLSNKEKYINEPNIIFTGRKDRSGVLDILSKSKVGINYTPNVYPFNFQTSTKVLEYIACGLDVLSNDGYWVESFQKKLNYNFLKVNDLYNNTLIFRNTLHISDKIPSWEKVYRDTKIAEFIINY